MSNHLEVEDKYDVDDDLSLPPLAGLPGVAAVDPPVEHELSATYLDTADLALARARTTLRRRSGGEDDGWHLKLPRGSSRLEVQVPLGRSTRTAPKRLRDAVAGWTRDEPLRPVVTVTTHRTVHRLRDDRGDLLAEVCDDRVSATTAEQPDAPRAWREWEVELGDAGDVDLLAAAARLLQDAGATPSDARSKLVRALGDRAPVPAATPRPGKKPTVREVVTARLAEQLRELRERDPLVRADDAESVHRMRVAVRRLRGALASYRPFLDRAVTDPLREELRWLAGSLGEARDVAVMRTELTARLQRLVDDEPALVRGPVTRRLERELKARREQARAAVLETLRSPRYLDLVDRLEDLVAAPPMRRKAGKRAASAVPTRVRHDLDRVRSRMAAVDTADDAQQRDVRLHEARKAVKRARYGAEPLAGSQSRRFVRAAKRLQSLLGDHHDTVEARALLLQVADAAAAVGEDTFTWGVLHAREQQRAEDLLTGLPGSWRRLRRAAKSWT